MGTPSPPRQTRLDHDMRPVRPRNPVRGNPHYRVRLQRKKMFRMTHLSLREHGEVRLLNLCRPEGIFRARCLELAQGSSGLMAAGGKQEPRQLSTFELGDGTSDTCYALKYLSPVRLVSLAFIDEVPS